MAPGQLAATCLFGLEQERHFSTIYTAGLGNKLITAAELRSHTAQLASGSPAGPGGRAPTAGGPEVLALTLPSCCLGLQGSRDWGHQPPPRGFSASPGRSAGLVLQQIPSQASSVCTVAVGEGWLQGCHWSK